MATTSQTPVSNRREPIAFDDRTRKVLELRRMIRAGTYRPSAEEVAQALLRDWLPLTEALREPAPALSAASPDAGAFAARFVIAPTAPDQLTAVEMTA